MLSPEEVAFNLKRARSSWAKSTRLISKIMVFRFYSKGEPKCACCGEAVFQFLTIDHENGDGNQHRKVVKGNIYVWLVKNHFPPGFRVLCWNCNCGREQNGGVCPHEEIRKSWRIFSREITLEGSVVASSHGIVR